MSASANAIAGASASAAAGSGASAPDRKTAGDGAALSAAVAAKGPGPREIQLQYSGTDKKEFLDLLARIQNAKVVTTTDDLKFTGDILVTNVHKSPVFKGNCMVMTGQRDLLDYDVLKREWLQHPADLAAVLRVLAEKNANATFIAICNGIKDGFITIKIGPNLLPILKDQDQEFFNACGRLLLIAAIRTRQDEFVEHLTTVRKVSPFFDLDNGLITSPLEEAISTRYGNGVHLLLLGGAGLIKRELRAAFSSIKVDFLGTAKLSLNQFINSAIVFFDPIQEKWIFTADELDEIFKKLQKYKRSGSKRDEKLERAIIHMNRIAQFVLDPAVKDIIADGVAAAAAITLPWFTPAHAIALSASGLDYETVKETTVLQLKGLLAGLTREQVMQPWFDAKHLEAIERGVPYEAVADARKIEIERGRTFGNAASSRPAAAADAKGAADAPRDAATAAGSAAAGGAPIVTAYTNAGAAASGGAVATATAAPKPEPSKDMGPGPT